MGKFKSESSQHFCHFLQDLDRHFSDLQTDTIPWNGSDSVTTSDARISVHDLEPGSDLSSPKISRILGILKKRKRQTTPTSDCVWSHCGPMGRNVMFLCKNPTAGTPVHVGI